MSERGKTVKLFLPTGSPNGLLVAEVFNWTGKVLSFPMSLLPEVLKTRDELKRTGLYFLLGSDPEGQPLPLVYVGESDDLARRLSSHNRDESKSFCEQVVIITSKDENLTKAHGRYLEAKTLETIKQNGLVRLVNSTQGSPVNLPESDTADMNAFFEQLQTILPLLGYSFLQPLPKLVTQSKSPAASDYPVPFFQFKKRHYEAQAYELDGQFVVKAGALCRHPDKAADYLGNTIKVRLEQLLAQGLLKEISANQVELQRDEAFKSPSAAAAFVCGATANGRYYWRVKGTSQTYGDWLESQISQELDLEG